MLNRKPLPTNKQLGFTLIEVLLSIMIFAALSVAGYQVLSQVQKSSQASSEKTQRIEDLQRALIFLDNDFRQISPRSFTYEGSSDQVIYTGEGVLASDNGGVIFTRLGWSNPNHMFPRSQILKVGYRITDNALERVWFYYPDTEQNQEQLQRRILKDVSSLSFRFYYDGQWQNSMAEMGNASPKAIEVILELADYGEISRVYALSGEVNNSINEGEQVETN